MIPFATIWICVTGRRISAIHIQISALHDGGDLRCIGVRLQAQLVLALVDLLGIVAVDRIGGRPVGVLLGETADVGTVISGTEIIGLRLAVEVLAAVAERVAIQRVRLLFHAERIVIVGSCAHPGAARHADVFRTGGHSFFHLNRQLFQWHWNVKHLDFHALFFRIALLT